MSSCAVFDLDGTIIDYSSEQVFFNYLLESGEIPISNLLRWVGYFVSARNLRKAKANKTYLSALDYRHLCDIANTIFRERLVERISPQVYALVDFHRSKGRSVIILSGSLEILVRPFHDHLKADMMMGNELEVIDGQVTGQRIGLNLYGENKAKRVLELVDEHKFDLQASYAYGNHYSDAHKLKLFGTPVAVNPDGKLKQIAMKNGWQIQRFHAEK